MDLLEELRMCPSVEALRQRMTALSSRFGVLRRLEILVAHHEGAQQAICFLRLESEESELRLMKSLGVGRFGGELVIVTDLPCSSESEHAGPSSQWAEFENV